MPTWTATCDKVRIKGEFHGNMSRDTGNLEYCNVLGVTCENIDGSCSNLYTARADPGGGSMGSGPPLFFPNYLKIVGKIRPNTSDGLNHRL